GDDLMAPLVNQARNIDIAKEIFALSHQANVPIYPIQPCGLVAPNQSDKCGPPVEALDFLQTVASNTNGHAITQTNDFTPGIDSIFQENGSYYQIAYYPTNGVADLHVRQLAFKFN